MEQTKKKLNAEQRLLRDLLITEIGSMNGYSSSIYELASQINDIEHLERLLKYHDALKSQYLKKPQ